MVRVFPNSKIFIIYNSGISISKAVCRFKVNMYTFSAVPTVPGE